MSVYQVALVDDHHLVRAGLSALVESLAGFRVAFSSDRASELEDNLQARQVDVLLLDISLRQDSGIEVLKRLRPRFPDLPVIMLSMHAHRDYVLSALRAGATGYLLKDAAEAELELALRAVTRGSRYLSPQISGEVVNALLGGGAGTTGESGLPLTPRQLQILRHMAQGKSTKEIAYELDISVKTVETYRSQIMERLDIHNLAGLVRYAIRQGLVSLD